jgi:hypothetical protein
MTILLCRQMQNSHLGLRMSGLLFGFGRAFRGRGGSIRRWREHDDRCARCVRLDGLWELDGSHFWFCR